MALAASIYLATHILLQASASPSALLGEGAAQTLMETSGGSPVAPAPPPGSGLPSAPVQPIQIAQVQPQQQAETHVQAPAPRDLFIEDCYEIDAEGRGHIDWYGLGSEAEAEECFKQMATKAGTPDAFAEILRSNGMNVLFYETDYKKNLEGLKIFSGYRDAMNCFGPLNYWSNHLLNPIYFLSKYILKGSYSIIIRLEYKENTGLTPQASEVRYEFEFK